MTDKRRTYTKPCASRYVKIIRWPRIVGAGETAEVAGGNLVSPITVIEKRIAVQTPAANVWALIGESVNLPSFTTEAVSIEQVCKDRYRVSVSVKSESGERRDTIIHEEEVVESIPEKLIRYRLFRNGTSEDYVFSMEAGKSNTMLTMRLEASYRLCNHGDVELDMERILREISRLLGDP